MPNLQEMRYHISYCGAFAGAKGDLFSTLPV
jgi:hypothetical protein